MLPLTVEESDGNGSFCEPISLFGRAPHINHTCVAGCCIDGACVCQRGYVGTMCEHELRCALVMPGQTRFADPMDDKISQCETRPPDDDGRLVCECSRLGVIAALRFRLTPPTNAGQLEQVGRIHPLLNMAPQSW